MTIEQKKVIDTHAKQIDEQKRSIEAVKFHKNKIETEITVLDKTTEAIKTTTKKLKVQGKDFEKQITILN